MYVLDDVKRFDMQRKPHRQHNVLRPVTWLLSYPEIWRHRSRINRVNMKGLKPPYLLLCTHMAFMDFKVTTASVFPHRANYVVAIDGFIGRESLLRHAGCICKRKFTSDLTLVRHLRHVIEKSKDIVVIYPEARYSLAGTTAVLPESLDKLVKLLKVPVVVLNMHGHYIDSPCWNLTKRYNRIEADLTQIITQDEIKEISLKEINRRITSAFQYDEFRWQKENNIHVDKAFRADGLHKVLYQCPSCMTEFETDSSGSRIWCKHCNKSWQMTTLGELKAEDGLDIYTHVPDWYEFQRAQVREQILCNDYCVKDTVIVDALPNANGYIRMGEATLTHNNDGFSLHGVFDGKPFELLKESMSMYSCHIEYNYMGNGDCIDLSTLDDTYYLYPKTYRNVVTKIALATEELYQISQGRKKKPTDTFSLPVGANTWVGEMV